MIEVMASVVLIAVGILSLLTLLPSGWRLSGTSDHLGRAAGILQGELERTAILIMNGNNTITPAPGQKIVKPVSGSGISPLPPGDMQYTVETMVDNWAGSYKVRVKVTWPGNSVGIAESLIVGRQKFFAQ
jgi:hypothetical protein